MQKFPDNDIPLPADGMFPDWANWIAQDADGSWWAYEVEPLQHTNGWYENELGRLRKLGKDDPPDDWRQTLCRIQ